MQPTHKYLNRTEAGKAVATALKHYEHRDDVIVLALPRGGVPVAVEVASALHVKMDLLIVRKLGVPEHEELALGAITHRDVTMLNADIITELEISSAVIAEVIHKEAKELARRESAYRGDRPFPELTGKTVIIVDDGMATGATMRVAIKAVRAMGASSIVIAVPVADRHLCIVMDHEVDELICPLQPEHFFAVGHWYQDFPQTEDEEVHRLMRRT